MSASTGPHHVDQADRLTGVNYLELAFAVMGGAVAWLSRLVLASSLVTYSCEIGATWPLWATTAVTGLVAAAALASSLRFRRRAATGDDTSHIGTAGWLGLLGALFNITALVGIVFESVPIAFLDICRAALP
ncbi:MAG: hypothetical protein M3N17_00880 [Actinomycetota bacterium]|nr:hypothetical protein [Actinomycetota bacterium]